MTQRDEIDSAIERARDALRHSEKLRGNDEELRSLQEAVGELLQAVSLLIRRHK